MKKRNRIFSLLAVLSALVLVAGVFMACSKDEQEVKPGNDSGDIVDPSIPMLSEITYELAPDAVIVPEATAEQITNVDTLGCKLTLPANAAAPEVGQTLIINTPSAQLHDGLLAKVVGVESTSSGYVVSYRNAELKDAFKDINIPEQYIPLNDLVEHVYDDDGKEINFSRETRTSGSKVVPITLPDVTFNLAKGVSLTTKMKVDMTMRYSFQFADYEADYIGMKIDSDITVGADLSVSLDSKDLWQYKKRLCTIVCAAIPIGPVVLTPSIDILFVAKADGSISLEASVSYKRTAHTKLFYQKNKGLSGDFEFDPPAPDALTFSFGPKLEGAFSYGLALGGNIGFFGRTVLVRTRFNVMKKESVSAKFDMVEMAKTEGFTELLKTEFKSIIGPYLGGENVPAAMWDMLRYTSFDYSSSLVGQLSLDFAVIGKDVYTYDLPAMSFPIDSRKIFPQIEIIMNNVVYITDEGDATVTLHLKEKSLLGGLAEFRAEWKRLGAPLDEKPIVAYFDQKEALEYLEKDTQGNGADIISIAKLEKDNVYSLIVYMKLLGMDFEVFRVEPESSDVSLVSVAGELFCSSPTFREGMVTSLTPVVIASLDMIPGSIKTIRNGKKLHIDCYKVTEGGTEMTVLPIASFDIDDVNAIRTKEAKIQNLKVSNFLNLNILSYREEYQFGISSELPMTSYVTKEDAVDMEDVEDDDDDDDNPVINASSVGTWEVKNPNISDFNFVRTDWETVNGEKVETSHWFSLQNDPDNEIQVSVAFK